MTMKHGLARLTGAGAALALLASVAVAGPPGHPVRVGILEAIAPAFDPDHNAGHRALVEGLKELGYAPGRDIVFKYKSAEGDPEAVGRLAEELVASGVDILVTPRSRPPLVAARVTKTVPIIMVGAPDPVDTGLVKSLARPGGNVTGLSSNSGEISSQTDAAAAGSGAGAVARRRSMECEHQIDGAWLSRTSSRPRRSSASRCNRCASPAPMNSVRLLRQSRMAIPTG